MILKKVVAYRGQIIVLRRRKASCYIFFHSRKCTKVLEPRKTILLYFVLEIFLYFMPVTYLIFNELFKTRQLIEIITVWHTLKPGFPEKDTLLFGA